MRLPVGLSHPPESADMVAPAERDETLNLFCDSPVPAFEAEGGEVLKFMGDGRLAIFRIGVDADVAPACVREFTAARRAHASCAELSAAAVADGGEELRFGLRRISAMRSTAI